jgi:hypothetical protein
MKLLVVRLHPAEPPHPGPHRHARGDQPRARHDGQPRRARSASGCRQRRPCSPIQGEPSLGRTAPLPHPAHIQRPHSPLLRDPPQHRRSARRHITPEQPANPDDHHVPGPGNDARGSSNTGQRESPGERARDNGAEGRQHPSVSLPASHGMHLITVAMQPVPIAAFDRPRNSSRGNPSGVPKPHPQAEVQMFCEAVRGANVEAGCGVVAAGPMVTAVP